MFPSISCSDQFIGKLYQQEQHLINLLLSSASIPFMLLLYQKETIEIFINHVLNIGHIQSDREKLSHCSRDRYQVLSFNIRACDWVKWQ